MLSSRQELLLEKVVDAFVNSGIPVASKILAADPSVAWGSSTVRSELATLESVGLLTHPHTSAGRYPTDAGYRYYVDHLLPKSGMTQHQIELSLLRTEVDEAMRVATETLSEVTELLAIVSAPPVQTATISHIEVLLLRPNVLMTVIITSTGGVSKRVFTFDRRLDPGLAKWGGSYLNERLVGLGLGARMLHSRLLDPGMTPMEIAFINSISPAFRELEQTAQDTIYVEGAARLLAGYDFEVDQLNALLEMLERRVTLLGLLTNALRERDTYIRIGHENESPALRSLSIVAANYGLPQRNLGTVSVIGPTRLNYPKTISAVREAASQLSRFVQDVYNS